MLRALMIGLSLAAQARIRRVETAASRSVTFRRLLAETLDVPRRAGRLDGGACVLYQAARRRLVFDEPALARASDDEVALAQARQLARASMALPVEVREGELAAVQAQVRVMLELAAGDRAFSKKMAALAAHPPAVPRTELERAALAAALLAGDPSRLDLFAERVVPGIGAAVRLDSLEDPARPAAYRSAQETIGDRDEDARALSKKVREWLR